MSKMITETEAKRQAARIVGCFSSKTLDPRIYAIEIANRFIGKLSSVVAEAVEELLLGKYVPTIASVVSALAKAGTTKAITTERKPGINMDRIRTRTFEISARACVKYSDQLGEPKDRKLLWWFETFANMVAQYEGQGAHEPEKAAAWHFGVLDEPDPWLAGDYRFRASKPPHKPSAALQPGLKPMPYFDNELDFQDEEGAK